VTRRSAKRRILLALVLSATACSPQASDVPIGTGSCTTCQHHDAGTPSTGKDAGTIDAGSPDGGLDSGPDGGTSDAGFDGGSLDSGLPLTGDICPSTVVTFSGVVYDLCVQQTTGAMAPLDGVQVATLEPYSATVTSDGGQYTICMPSGVPTTLVFTSPSYLTLYMPEIVMTPSSIPAGELGRISLPCLQGVEDYVHELPTLDPALPLVYSQIDSITDQQPCGGLNDAGVSAAAGWVFTDSLADGGVGDGGSWPIGYLDPSNDLEAVSATFSSGEAVVYNIDPGAGYVSVQASSTALGSRCQSLNPVFGIDGRIYVAPNAVSIYPWIVP
jgi:hypothetical protein